MKKKVCFLIQEWEHPASRYRVLQYIPYLEESQIEPKVSLFPDSFCKWIKLFSEIQNYDILFVQKKRLWHWQLWYLKRKHVKIMYDFDDAIMFKSPVDGGRSFKRRRTFARMVRYSDLVIAGNQYLKSQAFPYNKNILIIPTAIDTSKYTMKDYSRNKEKVTIGWIGSKSSLPFLKESQIEAKVAIFPDSFFKWMILFSEIQHCDTLFVQKKRLWHWQLWYLRRKRIRIIYDFDDAVMFKSPVDGGGRSFKRQWTFARMVKYSDYVIAGNRYLKSKAMVYNKHNVIIIPTSIDTDKYTIKDYSKSKEKVTIGWIGSKSSLPFLKELIPAFDQLAGEYNFVELKIICNDFFECKKMPVIKKIWSLEDENPDLQDIDIGLAPLPNHEWTKGKCATKLLQYLSVGIPVVCSPVGVHKEIIQEGING
ncbi:MAG: hypothetical protein A2Z57_06870, partial [Planctomycetes bacterium RIFCSPHIGHO2_12_39_6]